MINTLKNSFTRFLREEDGSPTVEFVLIFPAFMILFVSAFDLGMYMTRHVMLERGLDMAVRTVRLNTALAPTHVQFKAMICNAAGILPECMTNLKLELIVLDPHNWSDVATVADCVDVDEPFAPPRAYQTGTPNQIMAVRACVLAKPMFPATGLSVFIPRNSGDFYALVSTSAFVMEPL